MACTDDVPCADIVSFSFHLAARYCLQYEAIALFSCKLLLRNNGRDRLQLADDFFCRGDFFVFGCSDVNDVSNLLLRISFHLSINTWSHQLKPLNSTKTCAVRFVLGSFLKTMEQLIRDLNSPQNQGRPDAINTIQRQLQRLQKDSSAWQLSLVLLDNDEQLLQFYGALTLAQKVNADWERDGIGQDRNHVSHLLEQLLRRYVELSISAANDLVIAKLSSALAAIFAKPGTAWAHPCRHVLSCMVAGQYVAEMQSLSVEELLRVNTVLRSSSLKACLRLASALQEEAGSSNKSQTGHRFDLQLSNNGTDVWQMLRYTLAIFSLHMQSAVTPESDYRLQVRGEESTYQKLLGEALQQLPVSHPLKS